MAGGWGKERGGQRRRGTRRGKNGKNSPSPSGSEAETRHSTKGFRGCFFASFSPDQGPGQFWITWDPEPREAGRQDQPPGGLHSRTPGPTRGARHARRPSGLGAGRGRGRKLGSRSGAHAVLADAFYVTGLSRSHRDFLSLFQCVSFRPCRLSTPRSPIFLRPQEQGSPSGQSAPRPPPQVLRATSTSTFCQAGLCAARRGRLPSDPMAPPGPPTFPTRALCDI